MIVPSGAEHSYSLYFLSVSGMAGATTLKCLVGSMYLQIVFSSIPLSFIVPFHRFERELEALRKELAEVSARSGRSSPTNDNIVRDPSSEDLSPPQSPEIITNGLPPGSVVASIQTTNAVLLSRKDI